MKAKKEVTKKAPVTKKGLPKKAKGILAMEIPNRYASGFSQYIDTQDVHKAIGMKLTYPAWLWMVRHEMKRVHVSDYDGKKDRVMWELTDCVNYLKRVVSSHSHKSMRDGLNKLSAMVGTGSSRAPFIVEMKFTPHSVN
jgi:hypothetical protein